MTVFSVSGLFSVVVLEASKICIYYNQDETSFPVKRSRCTATVNSNYYTLKKIQNLRKRSPPVIRRLAIRAVNSADNECKRHSCIFYCGTPVIQSVAVLPSIRHMLHAKFMPFCCAYDYYGWNISLLVGERFNSIAAGRNNSTLVPRLNCSSIIISVLYLLTDAGRVACRCAAAFL